MFGLLFRLRVHSSCRRYCPVSGETTTTTKGNKTFFFFEPDSIHNTRIPPYHPWGDHYLLTTLIPLWGGSLPPRKGGGKKGGLKTVLDESREKNTSTHTQKKPGRLSSGSNTFGATSPHYVAAAGPKSKVCFIIRYRAGTTTIVPFLYLPPPCGLLLIFFASPSGREWHITTIERQVYTALRQKTSRRVREHTWIRNNRFLLFSLRHLNFYIN